MKDILYKRKIDLVRIFQEESQSSSYIFDTLCNSYKESRSVGLIYTSCNSFYILNISIFTICPVIYFFFTWNIWTIGHSNAQLNILCTPHDWSFLLFLLFWITGGRLYNVCQSHFFRIYILLILLFLCVIVLENWWNVHFAINV